MKSSIRGVILGAAGLALLGLAGCGEDNEKVAGDAFKDTQTAPREILEQKSSKEEMKKHAGGTGSRAYGAAQKGMRK